MCVFSESSPRALPLSREIKYFFARHNIDPSAIYYSERTNNQGQRVRQGLDKE